MNDHGQHRWICLVLWTAMASPAAALEQNADWRNMRGAELHKLFANQELGDGVHYTYRFNNNGVMVGTDMGESFRGTWETTASQICWTWNKPVVAQQCYEVRRHRQDITFLQNGNEIFTGTLHPIHPR